MLMKPTRMVSINSHLLTEYTVSARAPSNPTNNAILDYCFYFESKGSSMLVDFTILDEHGSGSSTAITLGSSGSYKLSNVYRVDCTAYLPKPNSSIYTVRVFIIPWPGPVYIRNLNIVIEYMDGLPPNN